MKDKLIIQTELANPEIIEIYWANGELSTPYRLIDWLGDDVCFIIDRGFLRARKEFKLDTPETGWHSPITNPWYLYEGGEHNRNWNELRMLLVWFNKQSIKRTTTVIAVGGETTINIAGAAAALWKSGCRWVAVPTSLQLMVSHQWLLRNRFSFCDIFNLLGVTHKPSKIFIDPALAATMSYRRIVEGLLEATKLALFFDSEKFQWLLQHSEQLVIECEPNRQSQLFHLAGVHFELVNWALAKNIELINKGIVSANPAVLPLDLLFARALEEISLLKVQASGGFTNPKAAKQIIGHPRALAAGMLLAHFLAQVKGIIEHSYVDAILRLFDCWNLPTQIYPGWRNDADKIWTLMNHYAEANGFLIEVAIPVAVGKTLTTRMSKDEFLTALNLN